MTLLEVTKLEKHFAMDSSYDWNRWLRALGLKFIQEKKKKLLYAVDGVDLLIAKNQSVGLVGESGCGKSTMVKTLSRLLDVDGGCISLDGKDISAIPASRFTRTPHRADIQVVFQDSHESLNPRYSAFQCIADPLRNLSGIKNRAQLEEKIYNLADRVNFPKELLSRLPHQLSGGQKARVNIARAIATSPKLLILDEPTSALDVSIQAVILQLLDKLRQELQISFLFVSHDLNVVRMICDKLFVMYMGKIVESGDADTLFYTPKHPYTRALISSIPSTNNKDRIRLTGEISSPINPDPNRCRFYGRCPNGEEACMKSQPELKKIAENHYVACHFSQ